MHIQRQFRFKWGLAARMSRAPFWGGVLAQLGCLGDLPPLQGIGGVGGFSGAAGDLVSSGSAGEGGAPTVVAGSGGVVGGSGGSENPQEPCGLNAKLCGDTCVERSPEVGCGASSCEACPSLPNSQMGCSEAGECQVVACAEGFADCDGDSFPGQDLGGANGCEYSFGSAQSSAPPLGVPFGVITIDGSREDWQNYPVYRMEAACADADIGGSFRSCEDDEYTPISAIYDVPLRRDLDAYFRVSWSGSFFQLLVETFDDEPFAEGDNNPGCTRTQAGAEVASCEDSATVFFDGMNNRSSTPDYGNDDQRVFLGLSGAVGSKRQTASDDVLTQVSSNGPYCSIIEARLSWRFLVGFDGAAAEGQFPPVPGNFYGFDVSFSDWDTEPGDTNVTRQSQVFWVDPGPDYRIRTAGFEAVQLLPGDGSHDAGAQ